MATSSGGGSASTDTYTWIGLSGALWATPSNWRDVTAGNSVVLAAPGAQTAVTIANAPGTAYRFVGGGGTAASLGITGNIDLIGGYGVGGTLSVGSLTAGVAPAFTAGALALSSGGSLAAGAVNLISGALALASGAMLNATGGAVIGFPGGYDVASNGTYAATAGASGTLNLFSHATLSLGGGLAVNAGAVNDMGGAVSIAGGLSIGTAGSVVAATPLQSVSAAFGQVVVSAGGTLSVGGALASPDGMLVADGAGARIGAAGTLTTGLGGLYASGYGGSASGALAALNGGSIQLGGLILNAPGAAAAGNAGVAVDGLSSIEIGTLGGAAAGAITVDAGRTLAANASAGLVGTLIDNGLVLVTAGTLSAGGLGGSGSIGIAANAGLALTGTIGSGETIVFLGTNAALAIPYGTAFGALLSGFQTSDTISVPGPLSSAGFTPGIGSAPGTLTLGSNGVTVETIRLSGTYTGMTFTLAPTAGGSAVGLIQTPPTDTYAWAASNGGAWAVPPIGRM